MFELELEDVVSTIDFVLPRSAQNFHDGVFYSAVFVIPNFTSQIASWTVCIREEVTRQSQVVASARRKQSSSTSKVEHSVGEGGKDATDTRFSAHNTTSR